MVIGKLQDFKAEDFFHPNIRTAFAFLSSHDLMALPEGKTVIDGDNVYLNRSRYKANPIEQCKLEGHQLYLDLQLVLKGKEGFGYVDLSHAEGKAITEYDAVKDRTFYQAELDGILTLHENCFALVYPQDLHMPSIHIHDETIEKVVVKIKL